MQQALDKNKKLSTLRHTQNYDEAETFAQVEIEVC